MTECQISSLRCAACGEARLLQKDPLVGDEIQLDSIRCAGCGATYDSIDGVPFIGNYEAADYIGLIEVVATSKQPSAISADYIRSMNRVLKDYDESPDKEGFAAQHSDDMVRASWWPHRYHEWLQVNAIIEREKLEGAALLNVGAGIGTDAVRLSDQGARVTCIDYSPTLTSIGRRVLPEASWIGGFSHVLPFQDESFDIVCANAALHHMRSVPLALREMLRVLKPGGFLFTTGDPFRPDDSSVEHEFTVFNRHEAVLGGVNEGIIPFGQIYDTLAAFQLEVQIFVLADVIQGPDLADAVPIVEHLFADKWVPLVPANIEALRRSNGGVATLVRKNKSVAISAPVQAESLISPGKLTQWIRSGEAYPQLALLAPDEFVDLPFPGQQQTWFDLLNGWMKPEAPFETRQGFKRARWLLNIPIGATSLDFDARILSTSSLRLEILINGTPIDDYVLSNGWQTLSVDVKRFWGKSALVELRLCGQDNVAELDQNCFVVRNRTFETQPSRR